MSPKSRGKQSSPAKGGDGNHETPDDVRRRFVEETGSELPKDFLRSRWARLKGLDSFENIGDVTAEDVRALCRRDPLANARNYLDRFSGLGGWLTKVRALEKALHKLQGKNGPLLSDAAQFAIRYRGTTEVSRTRVAPFHDDWSADSIIEKETNAVLEFTRQQLIRFAEETIKEAFIEFPPSATEFLPWGLPEEVRKRVSAFRVATISRGTKLLEVLKTDPRAAYKFLIGAKASGKLIQHKVDLLPIEEGGQGLSLPSGKQQRPKRPYRSQVGYTPPSRTNKGVLKTPVDATLRDQFHNVAHTLGVTSEVLLRHVASSIVSKASDPLFLKSLRRAIVENEQQSDKARANVLNVVSDAIIKRTLG